MDLKFVSLGDKIYLFLYDHNYTKNLFLQYSKE